MKRISILILLFSITISTNVFANTTENQNIVDHYMLECKNNNLNGCFMIAISEYNVNQKKSIGIAKMWIKFLLNQNSRNYAIMYSKQYINFYRIHNENVSWFKNITK